MLRGLRVSLPVLFWFCLLSALPEGPLQPAASRKAPKRWNASGPINLSTPEDLAGFNLRPGRVCPAEFIHSMHCLAAKQG